MARQGRGYDRDMRSMTKEVDDKQLVFFAQAGDSDAFVELMDR